MMTTVTEKHLLKLCENKIHTYSVPAALLRELVLRFKGMEAPGDRMRLGFNIVRLPRLAEI